MDNFLGEISTVGFDFAPVGWSHCDGQLLPISQNQALFSLLGTTYGGDGRTTFALPDMRSRVPMHAGTGPGLTNRSIGQRFGAETITLIAADIPSHTHSVNVSTEAADKATPAGNLPAKAPVASTVIYGEAVSLTAGTTGQVQTTGGSAHNNVQPYNTLNYMIALTGIYPPRN